MYPEGEFLLSIIMATLTDPHSSLLYSPFLSSVCTPAIGHGSHPVSGVWLWAVGGALFETVRNRESVQLKVGSQNGTFKVRSRWS